MATLSTFLRNNSLVTRTRNEKGQFVRGDFEKANIAALIIQLQEKAKDILYRVFTLIGYNNDLGNLIDSTACAIYVDGELVEDSIMYAVDHEMSIKPSRIKKQSYAFNSGMTGREAIEEWFSENKHIHNKKNTVQLITVAAMHYGYYLETGSYGGPRIRVISGIADAIEDEIWSLASEAGYKPSLTGISGYSEII
jgi:hypothetical protein